MVLAFVSAPINIALVLHTHSLDGNAICGIVEYGRGTYTAEGITKLCEGLKGSAMTSLECAPAP